MRIVPFVYSYHTYCTSTWETTWFHMWINQSILYVMRTLTVVFAGRGRVRTGIPHSWETVSGWMNQKTSVFFPPCTFAAHHPVWRTRLREARLPQMSTSNLFTGSTRIPSRRRSCTGSPPRRKTGICQTSSCHLSNLLCLNNFCPYFNRYCTK